MQEAARYQAVLEILGEVFQDRQPADNIINDYLRHRRYIGSGDRRFIVEEVWKLIRRRLRLAFEAGSEDPRRLLLVYLKDNQPEKVFTGGAYAPAALSDEERRWLTDLSEAPYPPYVEAETPQWLYEKIGDMAFLKALNQPASADFRINRASREAVAARLAEEGIYVEPTPHSPLGLRATERVNLNNCAAYQEGWFDVQDEASQLAALLTEVRPEHKIVDYCAGAGGKSLTMAYLLGGKGRILAHDADARRLQALRSRMERLGVKNIELTEFVATTDKDFDRFVIDAPCSGTGTWRRSPDAKFRLTPQKLSELNRVQDEILETAWQKTKSGGRIIYMTCSVLREENEAVFDAFAARHAELRPLNIRCLWEKILPTPYPHADDFHLRLSPLTSGTDGFFVAIAQKG